MFSWPYKAKCPGNQVHELFITVEDFYFLPKHINARPTSTHMAQPPNTKIEKNNCVPTSSNNESFKEPSCFRVRIRKNQYNISGIPTKAARSTNRRPTRKLFSSVLFIKIAPGRTFAVARFGFPCAIVDAPRLGGYDHPIQERVTD